jgi:hypothetical protein
MDVVSASEIARGATAVSLGPQRGRGLLGVGHVHLMFSRTVVTLRIQTAATDLEFRWFGVL